MPGTTKVAIVGGGMGGLATAFELELRRPGQYEITIYERDWRLGGKGASGRHPDDRFGRRIEEHGLHVLMGFYDNVFEILNQCYTDLRNEGVLPRAKGSWWNGVLQGMDDVYFTEPPSPDDPEQRWRTWRVPFAATDDLIGKPARPLPSIVELATAALKQFWHRFTDRVAKAAQFEVLLKGEFGAVVNLFEHLASDGPLAALESVVEAAMKVAYETVSRADASGHQWFVSLYVAGANLLGMIAEVLPNPDGFRETLDDQDYKEWLQDYNPLGLSAEYLWESPPINAVYDLVFSRGEGFGFAAGSALYDTLFMLFRYQGHVFYKMAGGMGDVVFAPLYLWLNNRPNIQFRFFHDLTSVHLAVGETRIEGLSFNVTRQVTAPDGYKPLVYIDCEDDDGNPVTLPCWPNAPDPAQTTEETTSITVADFDRVVLAIPVGAIAEKTINGRSRCEDLYVDERFRRMATGMVTRGTRAVQLWFSTDLHGLGWRPVTDAAHGPVLGSYKPERKLNSWADMTQVAPREPWLNHTRPHNITYLCDVYDDPTDHATSTQCVHDEALSWLQNHAGGLWPCAANGFPWDKLIDPNNRTAAERFESQYWRANTKGSDRYVLGAPRTTRLRLDPHGDTQFTNLFLAGDWVKTPLNAGCVEGAAMGGRIAAQRILDLSPPQPLAPSPPPQTASSVSRGPSAPVAPPPYIARDGDLPLLPPVEMNHVKMHGYFVRADRVALQQLLADTFQHTGVTCELLIPVVMIASARCDEIRSARPDDGYLVENELGFWVPVRMTWSGGSSIGFYLPYLFVDDPAAWQAGRELYGFNKILSEFRYAKPDDVDPAEVRAQVLPTRARTTRLDKHTVATWSGFAAHTPLIHWSTGDVIEKMLRHVCDIFGHALPELSLPELSLPELPLFFLKQFRDARDGSSACERAVIAARARLRHDSMSGGLLLPHTHTLTLTRHATIDIANTLGLPDTITPDLGIWAEFSLTIDPGQVLA